MSVTPLDPTRSVATTTLRAMKEAGRRIVMVTAYDTASARLVDAAGVDVILVGDSLGMTVLGYESTLPVTMDDMIHHTAAVSRGARRALVVGDMPFMSFQASPDDAVRNAGRFLAEGGAAAVKLEGGRTIAAAAGRIVSAGIPVMGHVGLTPQSVHALGGYKVQAKETAAALALVEDCAALADAGVFAIVLECIPAELAALVSREIDVPTIGIGAGPDCDGEVQVFHDLLGMSERTPRHARRYAELAEAITGAVAGYATDVREGAFPAEEQSTRMDPAVLAEVEASVRGGFHTIPGPDRHAGEA